MFETIVTCTTVALYYIKNSLKLLFPLHRLASGCDFERPDWRCDSGVSAVCMMSNVQTRSMYVDDIRRGEVGNGKIIRVRHGRELSLQRMRRHIIQTYRRLW